MVKQLISTLKKAIHWLFPQTCLFCLAKVASDLPLCVGCFDDLPWNNSACFSCGSPLPFTNEQQYCARCIRQPMPFTHSFAMFRYEQPIVQHIIGLKFYQQLGAAAFLGELMALQLQKHYQQQPLPELIIPIPLHPKRLRQRGFNQALLIAKPIARRLGIALSQACCQRIKHTVAQTSLSKQARLKNIRNAFQLTEAIHATHVALVDDVMTTGQTARDLSLLLKKNGVLRVDVWVCAHARG